MPPTTLERARRWVFARHAHPISAWTRWASTPLVVVPLWTRRRWHALPIAAWMAINPVMTPPVTDDQAFATRAILGEERWIADSSQDTGLYGLNVLTSVSLATAAVAAWKRRPWITAASLVGCMSVTLLVWQRYAELYDRQPQDGRSREVPG